MTSRIANPIAASIATATVSYRTRDGEHMESPVPCLEGPDGVHVVLPASSRLTDHAFVSVNVDDPSTRSSYSFDGTVRIVGPAAADYLAEFAANAGIATGLDETGRHAILVPDSATSDSAGVGSKLVRRALSELTPDECRARLTGATIGRLGLGEEGLVEVIPVAFSIVDDQIVFVSEAGRKRIALELFPLVTFEVDSFDTDKHHGWSVLVRGLASVVGTEQREALIDRLPEPWFDQTDAAVITIEPFTITGREIVRAQ